MLRVVALRCLPNDTGRRAPAPRSRVGQKLSNLTTSRVVVLVLSMLFILPAFNIGGGMYGTPPDLGIDGLKVKTWWRSAHERHQLGSRQWKGGLVEQCRPCASGYSLHDGT